MTTQGWLSVDSPPPSLLESYNSVSVISTNELGMVIDDAVANHVTTAAESTRKRRSRPRRNVSKHFQPGKPKSQSATEDRRDLCDIHKSLEQNIHALTTSTTKKPKRRKRKRLGSTHELATATPKSTKLHSCEPTSLVTSDTPDHASIDSEASRTRKRRGSQKNGSEHLRPLATTDKVTSVDEPRSNGFLNNVKKLASELKGRQTQPTGNRSKHLHGASRVTIGTPPTTPVAPRIIAGINIDELSSDSSLTEVPSDIGIDPFESPKPTYTVPPILSAVAGIKVRLPSKSPYFTNKPRPHFISCLPFPPLSEDRFGLMQERLAKDPFRLLIATIFLNRTRGEQAMPVFFQLLERYPTVADLASADVADVTTIIHRLGFQNQRARKCVGMAKAWLEQEPVKGRRWRKLNYPNKGDGRDVKADEVMDEDDARVAFEISNLPGLGPYSHDSWRMFCRDKLRGLAESWNGEGASADFEPEWKRVLPTDKELRAYLTWMWLKEGFVWNKETGSRTRAGAELMEKARGGGIVQEAQESEHLLLTTGTKTDGRKAEVNQPAGFFT